MQLFHQERHRQQSATLDAPSQPSADATPQYHGATAPDVEKQPDEANMLPDKVSAFKGLGWLDRFLAIWILLAMVIGVLLGNFVPNTGPALQKGKFVGVSVPIGKSRWRCSRLHGLILSSHWVAYHDVSDIVQN